MMTKKLVSVLLAAAMTVGLLPQSKIMANTVEDGKAGDVLNGDYVVITNTSFDTNAIQKTGKLYGGSVTTTPPSESQDPPMVDDQPDIGGGVKPPNPPATTTVYTIGQELKNFYQGKSYTLVGIGKYSYIWMENSLKDTYDASAGGKAKLQQAAQEMADVYDGQPYAVLNSISSGKFPYNDNAGKLSIMLEEMSPSGFYAYKPDITAIHVKAPKAEKYAPGAFGSLTGLLVHEGQHAIFANLVNHGDTTHAQTFRWFDEGLAVASMDYLWGGSDPTDWLKPIKSSAELRNGSSLIYANYRGNTAQDYSMGYLFVRYLINQMNDGYNPQPFLESIYKIDASKLTNYEFIDAVLKANHINMTPEQALKNFYIAVSAQEKTGIYGFRADPVVYQKVLQFPAYPLYEGEDVSLKGSASIVIPTKNGSFTVPTTGTGKDITFTAIKRASDILKPAGTGTAEDPYQIASPKDMNAISQYPNAHFKLMKDIDFGNPNTPSASWLFTINDFKGVLDGNGYSLKNVNRPLFSKIGSGGVVKNLHVDANFTGDFANTFGVLALRNEGLIKDTGVSGNIHIRMTGANIYLPQAVGALVGINSAEVERSYTDANMQLDLLTNASNIGGLIGENEADIKDSYSQAVLHVNQPHDGSYIVNTGGLVGYWRKAFFPGYSITNSYSTTIPEVTTTGSQLRVNTGSFTGLVQAGGNQQAIHSYALNTIALTGSATDVIPAAMGKSEAELKQQSTFEGWDLKGVWNMQPNAYPTLYDFTNQFPITANIQQTSYYVGEKMSVGFRDTITYNGTTLPLSSDMISGFDSSKAGLTNISISFRGSTVQVPIEIKAPTDLTSLKVIQKPNKTEYALGQTFDPAGLVLEAVKDGRTFRVYGGYQYDKHGPLGESDQTVTVEYGNQTIDVAIRVQPKKAQSLQVITRPDEEQYYAGATLNLSKLIVQITYNDGTTSANFGVNDFKANGVQLGLVKDGVIQSIQIEDALSTDANGKALYAYVGVPSTSSPNARITTIRVVKGMSLPEQNVRFLLHKDHAIKLPGPSGGSGSYTAVLKSGTLPNGISQSIRYGGAVWYSGIPTSIGKETLVYEFTDTSTKQKIEVNYNLSVEEALHNVQLQYFRFEKRLNQSAPSILPYDVEGVISDTGINITVPAGTNVTNLKPSYVGKNGEASPDSKFWSGSPQNFTNTVIYPITAEDGTVQKIPVTVHVADAAKSANANLVSISGITLQPAFDKDIVNYKVSVANDIDTLQIHAVTEDNMATYKVIGADKLVTGVNLIYIDVTAENGIVKRYNIEVTREAYVPSDNTFLSHIGGIALTPSFDKNVASYAATVPYTTDSIQITATPESSKANVSIQGNGSLIVGVNRITITVIAENNAIHEYYVDVTREKPLPSNNALLSDMEVEGFTLTPSFDKNVVAYTLHVPNAVTSIDVAPISEDPDAVVQIVGGSNLVEGENQVYVNVTAEDGKTRKTYTIVVTREGKAPILSNNANLAGISGVTLHETFAPDKLNYTATVGNDVTQLAIVATPEDTKAQVTVSGADNLQIGLNTLSIQVIAEDRTKKTYTIAVTREDKAPVSNNAKLDSITGVHLNESFSPDIYNYTAVVEHDITALLLNVKAQDSKAKVEITGADNLQVGVNNVSIKVTAEDGTTENTYTIVVTRKQPVLSNNANLAGISGVTLHETFAPDKLNYTATVGNDVTQLPIVATPEDTKAQVTISGADNLQIGLNTLSIQVIAEDRTKKTYTIAVTREDKAPVSNNAKLDSITGIHLNETFSPEIYNYTAVVEHDITALLLNVKAQDSNAKVEITGADNLQVGVNNVSIKVTAEDGTTENTYTIVVTRKQPVLSNNANLAGISGVTLHETFAPDKLNYTATVGNDVTQLPIVATPEDTKAQVTINGADNLQIGLNTLSIQVIAEDGTKKIYTIAVTREDKAPVSNNAKLDSITGIHLNETFSPEIYNYTAVVEHDITALLLNVKAQDSKAKVEITGADNLQVGVNNVSIKVTAEDGTTENTYTIVVTRKQPVLSNNANLAGISGVTLHEVFAPDKLNYTATVSNDVTKLAIVATPEDTKAQVTVNGADNLQIGLNTVSIQVIAEDGTKKSYHIKVVREDKQVSDAIVKFQQLVADISENVTVLDTKNIVNADAAFNSLSKTDIEKLDKKYIEKLAIAKEKLAIINHTSGNISIANAEWFIQLRVQKLDAKDTAEKYGLKNIVEAYDITLYNVINGKKYEPDNNIKIFIKLLNNNIHTSSLELYHVMNGKNNQLKMAVENGIVEFTTKSFSPFVIISKEIASDNTNSSHKPEANVKPNEVNTADYTNVQSLWLLTAFSCLLIGGLVVITLKRKSRNK